MRVVADVAIIGSGFGGSVTALVLDRIGLRPVLIDRGSHPRFAIGESSTPTANLVLRDLARTCGLRRLEPLAKYGTWRGTYPDVVRGLKRGFSYFAQRPEVPFQPRPNHADELLVAASRDDLHGDTHWLRSDVDAFLVGEVQAAGIPYLDQTELDVPQHGSTWRLAGMRCGRPVTITAPFLIDASGEGAFLPRALFLGNSPDGLHTASRAIYGHFVGVRPWRDVLRGAGGQVDDHPFDCDRAALHQVLDDGWMWQLRFDNGVTSAGFALDTRRAPLDPHAAPGDEWGERLRRYPALAEQFADARLVQPATGLRRTPRLQRRTAAVAGENWALLPHTAGFIDPLHSSGIAQTLCGIERLTRLLADHWGRHSLAGALRQYDRTVHAEIALIDELVHACYASLGRFPLFASCAMLYFAAATTYERRRMEGQLPSGAAFLCADDPPFRAAVRAIRKRLTETLAQPAAATADAAFERFVADALRPFNHAGLCDPAAHNLYRYTALP